MSARPSEPGTAAQLPDPRWHRRARSAEAISRKIAWRPPGDRIFDDTRRGRRSSLRCYIKRRQCEATRYGADLPLRLRSDDNQQLPALIADLLRRPVAVIVTDTPGALAAKAATTTVPVVFVTGDDPVRGGLVASLNRRRGNVTGISFTTVELAAKQLGLLHELRPEAARVAVLVDSKFPTTERFVSEVRAAASAMGQQVEVF
ncbi:MAG: ABC transporter substrate binding protein [Rhodoplanes sp.]